MTAIEGVQLFGRRWRITVGTNQYENIDCAFQVKKTLKPEPNTCDLKLFNLNPDHRKQIEQNPALNTLQKVPVSIEAGYGDLLATIFRGELRAGQTTNDGPDVVTELSTGDGEKGIATARLNVPVGPGAQIADVMRQIASAIGVGAGNITQAASLLAAQGKVNFSVKGQVLKGNAADHLTDLCKSAGLEWSVQDGAVQILTLGQPLQGKALALDSTTGLVGSPTVDSKGVLSATVLMIPGVRPGQSATFAGEYVKGTYRITQCEYEGDTLGNSWYIKIQAEKQR